MSNVYAMCAYVCPLLQRFGTSSVVLKTLELGVVGLPHQTIEDLSSNDTSTVVQLVTALQMMVCLHIKGSYHRMVSLSGREILSN